MSNEVEGFHYSFILEEFEDSWSHFLKNFKSERFAMDGPSKCQRHLGDVKKSASFCAFRNLEPLLKSQGRLFNNQLKRERMFAQGPGKPPACTLMERLSRGKN
jgi:hypothetical protein